MSFFDHLTSLDAARWGSVTSGSGTVTQSGSYVEMVAPAGADAAFLYLKTKVDKTKNQIYAFSMSRESGANAPFFWMVNDAGASPSSFTGAGTNVRFQVGVSSISSTLGIDVRYFNTSHVAQYWNQATPGWQTTAVNAVVEYINSDYFDFYLETDATNGFRFGILSQSQTSTTWSFNQSANRIVALTNWVAWSAIETSGDLWLLFGEPLNNTIAATFRIDRLRYADGTKQEAMTNAKSAASGNYDIRLSYSYDGKFFVPYDRTTTVITNAKDPWVVDDGSGTLQMFYRDESTSPKSIGRATATSMSGTWTAQTAIYQSGANHAPVMPAAVNTPWETSGREWQCLFTDHNTSNNVHRIRLLTCATPGGTWTDQGDVLSEGGTDEDKGVTGPVPLHRNGAYEVWYTGLKDVTGLPQQTGFRATGSALSSLTKDGLGARLPYQDAVEAITANLNGASISLASTIGFAVDMPVYLDQDSTADNWSAARIKSIVTNTSLALYSTLKGFTTASGAKVMGANYGNQQIRQIRQVGSEWWIYGATFAVANREATFVAFQEELSLLIVPAGTDLLSLSPSHYSWIDSPCVPRGSWSNERSNENISLVNTSVAKSLSPARRVLVGQAVNRAATY